MRPDRKGGEYLAKVRKPGKAIVNVNVVMNDGSIKKVGAQEFRVKRVPDPIATLGKVYVSGKIKAGQLKVQRGIVADLKDFVDQQIQAGYSSASEFVRELIRNAQRQAAKERLETLLLSGLDSGPATRMSDEDWKTLRERAETRWAKRADGERDQ